MNYDSNQLLKKDNKFSFIKSKTNELNDGIIDLIIKLKEIEWTYGYKSQKTWFSENVNINDTHYMIFYIDKLIGYGLLRNISNTHYILDTIIVNKNYRKQGFGIKIVNSLIKNITNPVFLLCKEQNISFYNKTGFNVDENINFTDKNTEEFTIMSINNNINLNILKNIHYY